jgi:hypothetical protein
VRGPGRLRSGLAAPGQQAAGRTRRSALNARRRRWVRRARARGWGRVVAFYLWSEAPRAMRAPHIDGPLYIAGVADVREGAQPTPRPRRPFIYGPLLRRFRDASAEGEPG